jgi:hypothetical protein
MRERKAGCWFCIAYRDELPYPSEKRDQYQTQYPVSQLRTINKQSGKTETGLFACPRHFRYYMKHGYFDRTWGLSIL